MQEQVEWAFEDGELNQWRRGARKWHAGILPYVVTSSDRIGLSMKIAPPKYTFDILPHTDERPPLHDSSRWQWVEQAFRERCRRYGFSEIRTPIFEATALYHRAVGDGTDIVAKETYDFETRGGDSLTLRPEGTAGVIRAFVTHRLDLERGVQKLFYLGPNFRYERGQTGRYRQHHQAGVEAIGSDDPALDAEIIGLAVDFYAALGLTGLSVKVNSVGTVESRAEYVKALKAWAEPHLEKMSADNNRRFETNPLRMLDSKEPQDIALLGSAPKLSDFLDDESREHFDRLLSYLDALKISYERDERLVRGFDYYTKTTFEIHSSVLGDKALGGGGRYNRLVEELGGPRLPGIGFGLGLDRILLALGELGVSLPEIAGLDAFCCPLGDPARTRCVALLAELRAAGLSADMAYAGKKLSQMLEAADSRGARFAVIIGDAELQTGRVQLRNMATKSQSEAAQDALATALAAG
jgi:histidyl-tRNA synthetase